MLIFHYTCSKSNLRRAKRRSNGRCGGARRYARGNPGLGQKTPRAEAARSSPGKIYGGGLSASGKYRRRQFLARALCVSGANVNISVYVEQKDVPGW